MLKWEESKEFPGCLEADFCNGLLTLVASEFGWSIYDGDVELCRGPYDPYDPTVEAEVQMHQRAAEDELAHRLRMAAGTLDSNWLEAEQEEEEEYSVSGIDPGFVSPEQRVHWSKPMSADPFEDGLVTEPREIEPVAPLPGLGEVGRYSDLPGSKLDLASAMADMDLATADQVRELLTTGETKLQNFSTPPQHHQTKPSGYDQILAAIKAEAEEVKL